MRFFWNLLRMSIVKLELYVEHVQMENIISGAADCRQFEFNRTNEITVIDFR